jgi:hypothetical protein
MKNTIKIALSAVATAVMMFAIGCSNNGSSPVAANDNTTTDALTSIVTNSSTDLSPICPDGQFPNDNGETPFGAPTDGPKGGGPNGGGPGMKDSSKFGQLPRILPCLKLTADQMSQLKALMEGFKTSADKIMKDERTAEQPLRTAADAQVKVIRDAVKAGTMTRDSAHAAIDAIRTQLIADTKPLRDAARASITDLQNTLLPQVRALLTADQQAIWDAWMTTGTIPCTPPPPPPHGGRGHK